MLSSDEGTKISDIFGKTKKPKEKEKKKIPGSRRKKPIDAETSRQGSKQGMLKEKILQM